MTKRIFSSLLLVFILMSVNLFPVLLDWLGFQPGGLTSGIVVELQAATLNVKTFGAVGNGARDDSAAIAAAIAAAQPGDSIYLPAGVYLCNDVSIAAKSNLTIRGQGGATIIRNGIENGSIPLLTFTAVSGLTIQDLAFDNRSVDSFGGVRFYDTEDVLINRTHFFDSAPLPLGATDRYAYVFGNGSQPHKNIRIRNNTIEDLQLEVDFGQGVTIQKNTLKRGVRTGAIGLFTINDGVVLENYLIDSNTIIDPVGAAIAVNIDPPDNTNTTFRNINITNNAITFNRTPTEAIHVGPADNSVMATGNAYEGIVIQKNLIYIAKGAGAQPSESALIKFNAGANSALRFKSATVAQNRIEGAGDASLGIVTMDLRYLENSSVNANTVSNLFTVVSFNRLSNTKIEQNYIAQLIDYTPYWFDGSMGGNTFQNNYYSGPVAVPLTYANIDPTDVLVQPTVWTQRSALRRR